MRALKTWLPLVGTAFVMLAGAASADDPKFAYGKRDEIAKLPPWAASVQAGFGMTTGNAQAINLSGPATWATASRRTTGSSSTPASPSSAAPCSRRSTPTADGVISPNEVFDITQTVSSAWFTKLRYDHFFDLNAIYVFTTAGGDVPAGKQFVYSAQVGYSRALWKTATNELVGEAGLDYTYQRYVVGTPDSINIAGLRGFVGYVGNPNPDLSYNASVEYIGNLNALNTPTGTVNSFGDNRLLMSGRRHLEDLRGRQPGLPVPRPLRLGAGAQAAARRLLLGARATSLSRTPGTRSRSWCSSTS